MLLLLSIVALIANVSAICSDVFPYELDIGFYWASISLDEVVWTKSCPDQNELPSVEIFDPERESIIYFHGLQPGSVKARHRFFIDDVELHPAVKSHLLLGRNFGVFQWVQFADEPLTNFIRAEGKIDDTEFVGGTKYVYLTHENISKVADGPDKTVSQVAFEHYRGHNFQARVHIIGHSLGSQLVVYLGHKIISAPNTTDHPRPRLDRVTMLDPVFSDSAKSYLNRNLCGTDIASVLGCYMRLLLDQNVAVELYRASFINRCIFSSEDNALMTNNSAAVALRLTQWGSTKQGYCWNPNLLSHVSPESINQLIVQLYNQHRAVIEWYVRSSVSINPPRICIRDEKKPSICKVQKSPSVNALMSDDKVIKWANTDSCLFQFEDRGALNANPSDDLFYTESCSKFNT